MPLERKMGISRERKQLCPFSQRLWTTYIKAYLKEGCFRFLGKNSKSTPMVWSPRKGAKKFFPLSPLPRLGLFPWELLLPSTVFVRPSKAFTPKCAAGWTPWTQSLPVPSLARGISRESRGSGFFDPQQRLSHIRIRYRWIYRLQRKNAFILVLRSKIFPCVWVLRHPWLYFESW